MMLFFLVLLADLESSPKGSSPFHSASCLFSFSSQEMVFASKLSDINRHRFCYVFSLKERALAMSSSEGTPNEKVESLFQTFYGALEDKPSLR